MARTLINTGQLGDGTAVGRADLITSVSGQAVIAKAIAGAGITFTQTGADAGTGDVTFVNDFNEHAINVMIGDGVNVIGNTPSIKAWIRMPFAGTITGHELTADASGSLVVDIWKTTYSTIPATSATKITSSTPPTLSSAIKAQDNTLASWTVTFAAGDYLYFAVTGTPATVKLASLNVQVNRTA